MMPRELLLSLPVPFRVFLLLLSFCLATAAAGQEATVRDVALRARADGEYGRAIALLRDSLTADSPIADRLLLAETLAWAKRFDEAADEYRAVLARAPGSFEAHHGLGRVLLWTNDYSGAARHLERALALRPGDAAAMLDLANARYWSGDWRAAARLYRTILERDPANVDARSALGEIDSATVPRLEISGAVTDDDQPYTIAGGAAAWTTFLDPLTSLRLTAGSARLDASGITADAPHAGVAIESKFPSRRLTVRAELRVLRFPDGDTLPLGGASIAFRTGKASALSLAIDRRELLATAGAIDDHANATTARLLWAHERDTWSAAASASATRYFDDNDGRGADAWFLRRVVNRPRFALHAGASAAYRDTDEQRFQLRSIVVEPGGAQYRYAYDAIYDPYWTPDDLREARLIGVARWTLPRNAVLTLHADGGRAEDRTISFGPDSGVTAQPPVFPAAVSRTFDPWRVRAGVALPLGASFRFDAAIERSSTVFYEADDVRVTITRSF